MKQALCILVAAILAGSGLAAFGTITVDYGHTTEQFYLDVAETTPLPTFSTFIAIWSLDDSSSGFNPANPLSPGGGDILLLDPGPGGGGDNLNSKAYDTTDPALPPPVQATGAGKILGYGAHSYQGENYGVGGDGLVGGYVYVVVFNLAFTTFQGNGGAIPAGTFYAIAPASPVGPAADQDPQGTQATDIGGAIDTEGSFILNQATTAIPEPGTIAMLGLGVVVLCVRRLRNA